MAPIGKPTFRWQDRCQAVAEYHISMLKEKGDGWRVEDTGKELGRSKGRISEDLKLASWIRTNPKVAQFATAQEALEYVKRIERDRRLEGIR